MPQNYGALERVLRVGEGRRLKRLGRAGRLHRDARAGLREASRIPSSPRRQPSSSSGSRTARTSTSSSSRRTPPSARPAKRSLGMRHFDVQVMGAIVLHEGDIAEMKTGEGKTLVATMPLYLNALTGENVHLVTVNDYLAKRDTEWMSPVYEALGMRASFIRNMMPFAERREAYARRHHLRHELGVRLRLPARQHGDVARGHRAARPRRTRSSTRSTRSWSTRRERRSSSRASPRPRPRRTTTSRASSGSSRACPPSSSRRAR